MSSMVESSRPAPKRANSKQTYGKNSVQFTKTVAEIVNTLITAYKDGKKINLLKIKTELSAKNSLSDQPKSVDIISAIPENYKNILLPLLKAKPVRTASGIAVVAVMCKPHRCPHLAMTGNICVYCFTEDHQLLTKDRGFVFVNEVREDEIVATFNNNTKQLEYQQIQRFINLPVNDKPMVEVGQESRDFSWSTNSDNFGVNSSINNNSNIEQTFTGAVTTGDHDWWIKMENQNSYSKVKGSDLVNLEQFEVLCSAEKGIHQESQVLNRTLEFMTSLGFNNENQKHTFLEIYGFWLNNGSLEFNNDDSNDCTAILFSPDQPNKISYVVEHLEQLKSCVEFTQNQNQIRIHDEKWVNYFNSVSNNVKLTPEKLIFSWVFNNLSMRECRSIINGLKTISEQGSVIYTNDIQFRDTLVKLCLHAGYWSHFLRNENNSCWQVNFGGSDKVSTAKFNSSRDVKTFNYTGNVYCVTVPNGLLFARRAYRREEDNQVTKATKPFVLGNCPGGPDSDFEYSTQSYTGYEPTSMRAIRARYNPYLQTRSRIDQLKRLGHNVEKVEFIIMGGTFMSLPADYRDYFIRNLHDALSGHTSNNVAEAVKYSEQSNIKCIGITIETRPDHCLKLHLSNMLSYGCTRLEIGVQSVYEDIARDTNRGHTVKAVLESFQLGKDSGFKIVAHMMPDLPNMGMERDVYGFMEFFENPAFRADGLKIYPTLVIRGTGLYELWKTGTYKNYSPDALVDLIAKILALVPPWTRIYRIQRDIPMPLVTSGVEYGNLRELCLARMKDFGTKCRDVRTREVGIQEVHHKVKPDQVELIRRDYTANGGWETFLTYEDPKQDILIGLLRLRKCSETTFRPELKGNCSIVRELHVYGSVVGIHSRDPTKFQHQGFGTLLMEEAERIAREEHGSYKLAVIAGVGTRHYYRKLGYELDNNIYMSKLL